MRKSVWEYFNKEALTREVKNAVAELRRDYYDSFSRGSQYIKYIISTLVSEQNGWKTAPLVLINLFGVESPRDYDPSFQYTDGADELNWDEWDEESLITWLADQEGIYEWVDTLADDFNDELQHDIMEVNFIPGNLYLDFNDGAYCLMLYVDCTELASCQEE